MSLLIKREDPKSMDQNQQEKEKEIGEEQQQTHL
jgi:hypothetical protein